MWKTHNPGPEPHNRLQKFIHTYIHTYVRTYIHTYIPTVLPSRSFTTSFVFPSFPVPAKTIEAHYWKKLTCGVIRSFNFLFNDVLRLSSGSFDASASTGAFSTGCGTMFPRSLQKTRSKRNVYRTSFHFFPHFPLSFLLSILFQFSNILWLRVSWCFLLRVWLGSPNPWKNWRPKYPSAVAHRYGLFFGYSRVFQRGSILHTGIALQCLQAVSVSSCLFRVLVRFS